MSTCIHFTITSSKLSMHIFLPMYTKNICFIIYFVECMVSSKPLSTSATWHCLVLGCRFYVVSPCDFVLLSMHITFFFFVICVHIRDNWIHRYQCVC